MICDYFNKNFVQFSDINLVLKAIRAPRRSAYLLRSVRLNCLTFAVKSRLDLLLSEFQSTRIVCPAFGRPLT